MAELSITASQVLPGANAQLKRGTAGVAIAAGKGVYSDATDSKKIKLADANASQAAAAGVGVALHAAEAGQPISYQVGGDLTLGAGAAPTRGVIYVGSATAGGICPAADLASGHYVWVIGVGNATNGIKLINSASGIVV